MMYDVIYFEKYAFSSWNENGREYSSIIDERWIFFIVSRDKEYMKIHLLNE